MFASNPRTRRQTDARHQPQLLVEGICAGGYGVNVSSWQQRSSYDALLASLFAEPLSSAQIQGIAPYRRLCPVSGLLNDRHNPGCQSDVLPGTGPPTWNTPALRVARLRKQAPTRADQGRCQGLSSEQIGNAGVRMMSQDCPGRPCRNGGADAGTGLSDGKGRPMSQSAAATARPPGRGFNDTIDLKHEAMDLRPGG
jgi:hypothetical protein